MSKRVKFQVRPLYLQVRDAFLERIKSGEWKPGAALSSEYDLAREWGISPGTMRKALQALERDHLITRRPGRGTFVRDPRSQEVANRFELICRADGSPMQGTVDVMEAKWGAASEPERDVLGLALKDKVFRVKRRKLVRDRPFAYEEISLPARHFSSLPEQGNFEGNLDDIVRPCGVLLARMEGKLRAASATPHVSSALMLRRAETVLAFEAAVFDTDGQAVMRLGACYHLQDGYCRLVLQ